MPPPVPPAIPESPQARARARREFRQRLAYFLIGLAIGLIMLGMFQRLRTQEAARRAAERQAGSEAVLPAAPSP